MPILFANDADLNGHKVVNLDDGTDPADGVNRSQLDANATADRNRANHTGTQLASTISNFDAAVQANRLDQMAAPTSAVDLNGQVIENLGAAVNPNDALPLGQAEAMLAAAVGGLTFKGSVAVTHDADVDVSNPGTSTFDGETVASGEVVILTDQTDGTENGPWTFNGSGSAMTRPGNFDDTAPDVLVGSFWLVERGTNADLFAVMTNDTFTLGTDTAVFVIRGTGGGPSNATSYAANVGTGSVGPYAVTHNLGSTDVDVTVRELAGGYVKLVSWRPTDGNTVSLEPDETWGSNSHRVYVERIA